jgi:hypothetical protein
MSLDNLGNDGFGEEGEQLQIFLDVAIRDLQKVLILKMASVNVKARN